MSQAYQLPASQVYDVKGAVGLFFDKGIMLFGRHVESEVSRASADCVSPMFAKSAEARAFARCMGDDMATSTAGYANPFDEGGVASTMYDEGGDELLDSGY